jgi:phospholipase C
VDPRPLGLVTALFAAPAARATTTPIGHLVVVFDEDISFDHYFGTYPNAANPAGEPAFTARAGTPAVNGLSGGLLTANPNGVNRLRASPPRVPAPERSRSPSRSAASASRSAP